MKILSLLTLILTISACSSSIPPLVSKENCKNTCALHTLEYKDYDSKDGCYCGEITD